LKENDMATQSEEFQFPDEIENKPAASAPAEEQYEIDVVDDTPAEDRGRPALAEQVDDPTDDELAAYSKNVQDRIKKLTHKTHDERRRADALQRERDELERVARATMAERDQLKQQFGQGAALIATQAKAMAETEVASAEADLKAAHEAFDTDAVIAAQKKLYAAMMKKDRAENFVPPPSQPEKSDVQSRPSDQETRPTLDDKTSSWMSKNKWFGEGGDEAMTGYALGLHQQLVKKHGEAFTRTDEYYSHIDKAVRQTFPDRFKGNQTRPTSIVASAGRVPAGPRKVQLTSTQVALAKRLGMTTQQYAAELVKLEQEN
jgi:hypothetical protein